MPMIQPQTIREIHRICREWETRPDEFEHKGRTRWFSSGYGILAMVLAFALTSLSVKLGIRGWTGFFALFAPFGILLLTFVYIAIALVIETRIHWKEFLENGNPFSSPEDRDLEASLAFLKKLSDFDNQSLLFVARSLETKSKRMEVRRVAIMGTAAAFAGLVVFFGAHCDPGMEWLGTISFLQGHLLVLKIGVGGFAFVISSAGILGLGSAWIHSSVSANRALTLRRVVEDREALRQ